METVNNLILLADKLDRNGLKVEAELVDGIIVKRSYDEETRSQLQVVIDSINSYVENVKRKLNESAQIDETTGEVVQVIVSPEDYGEINNSIYNIEIGTQSLFDLNNELADPIIVGDEDGEPEQESSPMPPVDMEAPLPGEQEQGEGEQEQGEGERWSDSWFRGRSDDTEASEEDLEGDLQNPDEDELMEETEGDLLSGDQRRTVSTGRGGVNVEQNLSNIGNITIE